jgi:hypothetical protein
MDQVDPSETRDEYDSENEDNHQKIKNNVSFLF